MKTERMINAVLVAGTILASAIVQAGAISGGGGGAYVCRDRQTGSVKDAELVDLWEGANLNGLSIQTSNEDVDLQIERALAKLQPLDESFYVYVRDTLIRIRREANILPDGVKLDPPTDVNSRYSKVDCPLEGMLYYDGSYDRLQIDNSIFSKLVNNTHIAASWVHEAVYKALRDKSSHTDSVLARKLTACLFSSSSCLKPETEKRWRYRCSTANKNVEFFFQSENENIFYSQLGAQAFGDPIEAKVEGGLGLSGKALGEYGVIQAMKTWIYWVGFYQVDIRLNFTDGTPSKVIKTPFLTSNLTGLSPYQDSNTPEFACRPE